MKLIISSAVGNFDEKVCKTWKLEKWFGIKDPDKELLFFGLYVDYDYNIFYNFDGKKTVFWCGSDILRLLQIPERQRKLKLFPETEHYCENEVEARELESVGLKPIIRPSFVEDIDNFPISFKPTDNPHVFLSGHPMREEEYGFGLAERLAEKLPEFTFHLYGGDYESEFTNVKCHGKVPADQFNEEIKNYQCGLRPNDHDGFSEITAKSVLMGQYPISKIPYKHIWNYQTEDELVELLKKIKEQKTPNSEAREYWRETLNNYPWTNGKKNI